MDAKKLMENFQKSYEQAVKENQDAMARVSAQYENTLARMSAELEAYLSKQEVEQKNLAEGQLVDAMRGETPEKKPSPPAGVWTNAPDGEKLFVLNESAAVMFLAVFERMGEVVQELQKMFPTGKKR